jgi:hypothetical protein
MLQVVVGVVMVTVLVETVVRVVERGRRRLLQVQLVRERRVKVTMVVRERPMPEHTLLEVGVVLVVLVVMVFKVVLLVVVVSV